jgi:hypothetical protein
MIDLRTPPTNKKRRLQSRWVVLKFRWVVLYERGSKNELQGCGVATDVKEVRKIFSSRRVVVVLRRCDRCKRGVACLK